jgi:glycosyltransferase 2 family protein
MTRPPSANFYKNSTHSSATKMEQPKARASVPEDTGDKSGRGRRKLLLNLLKVLISAGLIYWILLGTELSEILAALREATFGLLIVAFSLHLLGFTISAVRWRLLLHSRGTDASIRFLVESYIVGMFFNNFLPSTIGGDVYRTYDSWRLGQSKSSALAVVFVDRFLGLMALVLFALLALLHANDLTRSIPRLSLWLILGMVGMVGFIWLLFAPPAWLPGLVANLKLPFGDKIRGILEAFLAFRGQRGVLLKALLLSMVLQVNVIVHYYLIVRSLSLPVPFLSFFLIIPLATIITMLPISVNGIGVRENAYIFFFAPFAISAPEAVAFAWIAYGMVALQGLLGGILYAVRK